MPLQGTRRLPASQPEPVITYSLVADDNRVADEDGRTEPRLTTLRAARSPRFEEVAAPMPFDDLAPEASVVAPEPIGLDERPRSSFARLVVAVGILALIAGGAVLAVTYSGAIRPIANVGAPAGGDTMPPDALDTPEANVRVVSSPADQTSTVVREPPATAETTTATAAPAVEPAAPPPLPRARPTMDASAPAAEAAPRQETAAAAPPPPAQETAPSPTVDGDVNSLMSSVDQILAAEKARAASGAAATPPGQDGPAMDSVGEALMLDPSAAAAPASDPYAAAPVIDPVTGFVVEEPPPPPPSRRFVFDLDNGPVPPADIPNVSQRYSGW